MFAKVFGPPEDQIVVMLDTNDDDLPAVKVFFQPKDMGVCYACLTFEGSEKGEANAERHFESMEEPEARTIMKEFIRVIAEEEPTAAPMPTPKGFH